jgi:hypothetical protein
MGFSKPLWTVRGKKGIRKRDRATAKTRRKRASIYAPTFEVGTGTPKVEHL